MSNDQIIRSNKPHEVTIPEGSNSARSIRNKLGHREVEQEREETFAEDKQYTDHLVQAGSESMSDQQVAISQEPQTSADHRVAVPESLGDTQRVQVSETGDTSPDRVSIESSQTEAHWVKVESTDEPSANRVSLPHQTGKEDRHVVLPQGGADSDNRAVMASDVAGVNRAVGATDTLSDDHVALSTDRHADNRAMLPHDTSSDNRVAIPEGDQAAYRVTHDDDVQHDSFATVPAQGTANSSPVSIPSDSIQDSFAQVPDMTHTESAPVKVDGHGITDPSRVIVEEVSVHRADVPRLPAVEPVFDPAAPHHEEADHALVHAAAAPAAAMVQVESAQVSAQLADKKIEEFRGRVVKLRDEVDQLNRRLDEIKK